MPQTTSAQGQLKPTPLWMAILFFGIPALTLRESVYRGMPFLISIGIPWFGAYVTCYGSVLLLMVLATFVAYRLEGFHFSWEELKERLWLRALNDKDWYWIIGGFFVAGSGYLALAFTERWIANIPRFAPPAVIAYYLKSDLSYTSFMGIPLLGNWWMFIAIFLLLVFNILSEELWWRSYILPRQELSEGKGAWLVNGLLWSLFHTVLLPWTAISYLPICLTVPYVAQHLKSARSGMVIHFVLSTFNLLIPITLGILGIRI